MLDSKEVSARNAHWPEGASRGPASHLPQPLPTLGTNLAAPSLILFYRCESVEFTGFEPTEPVGGHSLQYSMLRSLIHRRNRELEAEAAKP
jgi:hypothetical protein